MSEGGYQNDMRKSATAAGCAPKLAMKVQLISLTERLNWSGRISATGSVTACRDARPERLRSKSAKRRRMMRLQ